MRKGLSLFVSLLMLAGASTAFAAEPVVQQDKAAVKAAVIEVDDQSGVPRLEQAITGNWVDQRGHRPISIKKGNINGYPITAAKEFSGDAVNGSCTMTVIDLTGNHIVPVEWSTVNGQRTMTLHGGDGKAVVMVPGESNITHAESVSGITLDMKLEDVKATNGAPARILTGPETQKLCGVYDVSWYWNNGMIITYDCRTFTVDRIFILADSSCAFDRSVLNCKAPLQRYADLYGFATPAVGSQIDMGKGEIIDFTLYPQAMSIELDDAYSDASISFEKLTD